MNKQDIKGRQYGKRKGKNIESTGKPNGIPTLPDSNTFLSLCYSLHIPIVEIY